MPHVMMLEKIVTGENRTRWCSSWSRTGGSLVPSRRWRQTTCSEWKLAGSSTISMLPQEINDCRLLWEVPICHTA